ncbi:MAG: Y-family DNA polymerase [Parachlamydiales bacterium]|nr:Y-family DNA polymerase [Parachlamydiales bacterium]
MYVLIDCNNFFATCETVFNPKLKNKPLVVLSNNDGCVIARSKEAKSLNIPMGAPIFEYKDLIQKKILHVFSSNFSLYGDMSMRVFKTAETFSYPMEIYSIDEAFLYIDKDVDFKKLADEIKKKIYKWTGLSVSVGIAKTKTLAKLANEIAKKESGTLVFNDQQTIDKYLKNTSIEDIWGIGRKFAKRLNRLDIYTAFDLTNMDDFLLKKKLTVNGLKTALELRGKPCYKLDQNPSAKKSITSSRSFGNKIENFNDLFNMLASFVSLGAQKLRKQKLKTSFLTVFITTSYHSKDPFYSNSCSVSLPIATSYTPDLISYAKNALKKIYKNGYCYKKAGVILNDLSKENENVQQDLFSNLTSDKKDYLMKILDNINFKANKKAVYFASEKILEKHKSASNMRSKKFTTTFEDLLQIK